MRHKFALVALLGAGCGSDRARRPALSSASAPVQPLPAALPPPAPPPPTPEQSVVVDAAEYGNGEALLGVEGSEADPPPTAGQAVSRAGRPTVARAPAARGAATEWCDVVGKRVTTGDCGRLREQRDALQDGVGGMDVPPSMFVGDRVDLLLVVGRGARAGRVVDDMVGRSRVVRLDGLKVGSVMAATLTGSAGLAISPAGEQHRDLGGADNAMWEWRVSAVAAGPQELRLRVATLALDARGAPTTLELKPRRFAVAVAVRPASAGERLGALPGQVERAANDWTDALKALGGLFVAAGATWGAWRALRRPGGAKATA